MRIKIQGAELQTLVCASPPNPFPIYILRPYFTHTAFSVKPSPLLGSHALTFRKIMHLSEKIVQMMTQ
jgi:hypothetical protein